MCTCIALSPSCALGTGSSTSNNSTPVKRTLHGKEAPVQGRTARAQFLLTTTFLSHTPRSLGPWHLVTGWSWAVAAQVRDRYGMTTTHRRRKEGSVQIPSRGLMVRRTLGCGRTIADLIRNTEKQYRKLPWTMQRRKQNTQGNNLGNSRQPSHAHLDPSICSAVRNPHSYSRVSRFLVTVALEFSTEYYGTSMSFNVNIISDCYTVVRGLMIHNYINKSPALPSRLLPRFPTPGLHRRPCQPLHSLCDADPGGSSSQKCAPLLR